MRSLAALYQASRQVVASITPEPPPRMLEGGGGSAAAAALVLVDVRQVGGTPGSQSTQCDFTYDIWPAGSTEHTEDNRLAEALPVTQRRQQTGEYEAARAYTLGLARRIDEEPYYELLMVLDEMALTVGCDACGDDEEDPPEEGQ